jgi:hypothetical protein
MSLLWTIVIAVILVAVGLWVAFATTSLILHLVGYALVVVAVLWVIFHLLHAGRARRGPGL